MRIVLAALSRLRTQLCGPAPGDSSDADSLVLHTTRDLDRLSEMRAESKVKRGHNC